MPKSQAMYRLRLLLTLSLAYSCAPQPGMPRSAEGAQPAVQASLPPIENPELQDKPLQDSASTEIKLLSVAEIDQLKASGLVEANNVFAWELFSELHAENPQDNLFISPVSAAIALQMAMEGADGETLTEMKRVLKLQDLSAETLLENMPLLMQKLQRPAKDIQLEVANGLWANARYQIEADYIQRIQKHFASEVRNSAFEVPDTIDEINTWANEVTHGKIPSVLAMPEEPAEIEAFKAKVMYLLNGIYFKGTWKYKFDEAETRARPFYTEEGKSFDVAMMRQFGDFSYRPPSLEFPHQSVALPYGDEGKVVMYIFLPTTDQKLENLHEDIRTLGNTKLFSGFYRESGSLSLPRFKIEKNVPMVGSLMRLGMLAAFSDSADFGRMINAAEPGAFISDVFQKTFVDVNEEGTEAAAVTVIENSLPSSVPSSLDFKVDHPFVFVILDQDTGQILFMGSITDPRGEK